MNVYRREMKAHRWGLTFWSIGMVFLVISGMAKYGAYASAGQSAADLMAGLPRTVQVVFGITGFDLTKASGFFGVLFLYLAVTGAIHAVLLGSDVISGEERDRTSEFLYAKPVSRPRVLTGKLAAGLTNVIVLNLVTVASSFVFVNYYGKGEPVTNKIVVMMTGLLFLQIIFFAIGAVVAGTTDKPKRAGARAMTILLVTFTLFYLINLDEKLDPLKYLTPFKYFDAASLMEVGLDPIFVALGGIITAASILGTYYFYERRDLGV